MKLLPCILLSALCVLATKAQDFDRVRAAPVAASLADSTSAIVLSPSAAPGLGLITLREGDLARQALDAQVWEDAPLRSRVRSADRVRTGADGRAEIVFTPQNVLRLAPATTLSLAKLSQEEEDAALEVELVVESGRIWAELDDLDAEDSFTVRTPVLGAAITGTGFSLDVDDGGESILEVLHGEVRVAANAQALNRTDRAIGIDSLGHLLKTPTAPRPVKGAPVPVQGPTAVAGPHPVSLDEWLVIVKEHQRLRIGAGGRVLEAGPAALRDEAWRRWNLQQNHRGQ